MCVHIYTLTLPSLEFASSRRNTGLRLQKKMLGMGVKSKDAAKHFIDDDAGALLDVLYELSLKVSGDVKVAKKLLKDVVKIAVKLGLLYRYVRNVECGLR